jgi:queuine tRNA-ribosyltransferase
VFSFSVTATLGKARTSVLTTPHGDVPGPFFQFVATNAAIRGLVYADDLERLGVDIVLANTYHLHLQPGDEVVAALGGLHEMMQWPRAVTTDSGGYQVFSLGQHVRLDADGVTFRSPKSGDEKRLTPEGVIKIQQNLGADIIMPLDVCTPFGATREAVAAAVAQTTKWAKRSAFAKATADKLAPEQVLYGIIQGGVYPELREQAAREIQELGFFGYAIGGEMRNVQDSQMDYGVRMTVGHLPADAPRYLMGAGAPEDIVRAVRAGVDQFDCVLPIRNARHGKLYRALNVEELTACLQDPERPVAPAALYQTLDIEKSTHARVRDLFAPDNPAIPKPYSVGYVHHLMRAEPPSGYRLCVLNNIWFYVQLFAEMRRIISQLS